MTPIRFQHKYYTYTSFNRSREDKYVSHKSRPAMQDMTPGLAPDPKMLPPFPSLGITDRLRRPILDHVLLGTRQNCDIIEKLLSKIAPFFSHLVSRATRNNI